MTSGDRPLAAKAVPDNEELAAQAFARRRLGTWTAADESELEIRLAEDPAYADAFRRVEQSWAAVGQRATSPELMALREQALSRARRASARRWLKSGTKWPRHLAIAATVAAVGIVLVAAFQLAPFGLKPGEYRTDLGEQRVIELEDRSRIALDAATRLRVRFSHDTRIVQLIQGQAQFSVAKDPARPFKVEAGTHTIVALGTVFTVEYVDREMHVAMLDGRVAILPLPSPGVLPVNEGFLPQPSLQRAARSAKARDIELTAGEELRVRKNGQMTVTPKANLAAATAWREGKVIFDKEPLADAVHRLNHYSHVKIEIVDPGLASMEVSGVFEAGDADAFVEALQSYLPVTTDDSHSDVIRLRMR